MITSILGTIKSIKFCNHLTKNFLTLLVDGPQPKGPPIKNPGKKDAFVVQKFKPNNN
jgi:hypothetical protein